MAKIPVIQMDRSESEPLALSDKITDAPFDPFLIKDLVVYQQAKTRSGNHATKSRSQVTGSGHKLFRQKGTGSARAGDAKAVQRRGGGVVHGPVPHSHAININKKVRKAAMRSALAEKIRRQQVIVLESVEPATHKTKDFAAWLEKIEAPAALIVVETIGTNLERAARNLPTVQVVHFTQLNVYNMLNCSKMVVTRQALEAIEQRITA